MDSIFKICKKGTCGITISGLEKDNDEYLSEDGEIIVSTRNYAYTQTITLNAVTSINSLGEEKVQAVDIVEHDIDCIDESDMILPIDGLYTITHIILPTEKWLQYVLDRDSTALVAYNLIYYFNTVDTTFMRYINGESSIVSIEEILSANANPPISVTEKTSTIIRGDKNTFCTCYINECFYKLCKDLLVEASSRCKLSALSVQNRDIIWMGLNVIKYLVELNQFYEAQRILESISQCGTLCKNITLIGGSGCGCNK